MVRMYRLAGLYEDAFRVAKSNCSSDRDPLLVQLAYWWCKSLAPDSASEGALVLLKKLNLLNQVIDFCCDNRNYQFAIDFLSSISNNELNDLDWMKKRKNLVRNMLLIWRRDTSSTRRRLCS